MGAKLKGRHQRGGFMEVYVDSVPYDNEDKTRKGL